MRTLIPVTAALGAAAVGYATVIERNWFALRRHQVPVLAPGSEPLRVLHLSDAHLTPGRKRLMAWMRSLDDLDPHVVVNTGDSIAHAESVRHFIDALGPLLDRPGVFVLGSNDLYAPEAVNPARYLAGPSSRWHIQKGPYEQVAGQADPGADLRVGIMHSPEPRLLDQFAADGYELLLAGHTHGGQLCLPFYGTLITNCGIDRERARGLHRYPADGQAWLHVSAGLGTSPWAPARFACRPEASLLTLVPRDPG